MLIELLANIYNLKKNFCVYSNLNNLKKKSNNYIYNFIEDENEDISNKYYNNANINPNQVMDDYFLLVLDDNTDLFFDDYQIIYDFNNSK